MRPRWRRRASNHAIAGPRNRSEFALPTVRGSRLAAVSLAEFATGVVRGEHLTMRGKAFADRGIRRCGRVHGVVCRPRVTSPTFGHERAFHSGPTRTAFADAMPRTVRWSEPMPPKPDPLKSRLRKLVTELMLIPGLSGYEGRVRRHLAAELKSLGIASHSDRLGNLIATLPGDRAAPSVMLFAHMDQLGLIVRKIEANGLIRVERLGGVPEKALPRRRCSSASARAGPPRRHRQQEPSRHHAGGEVPGRSLPGSLHRRGLCQRRRRARRRHRHRHARRLRSRR